MAASRSCEWCAGPIQSESARARFCSSACRGKHHRNPAAAPAFQQHAAATAAGGDEPLGRLAQRVHDELSEVGVLETVNGEMALALARRVDTAKDTGSAVATMTRELSRLIEAAMASAAARQVDRGSELAASVAEKLGRFS